MNILIFGPPGSGKGTQSVFLVKEYNLSIISVGNLLRQIISIGGDLGKKIQKIVESGNLVSDDIICNLLSDQLQLIGDNFLLDGFPRNLTQAHFLTEWLLKVKRRAIDCAIELLIPDEIAVSRMTNRLICMDCNSVYTLSLLQERGLVCIKCHSKNLKKRSDDTDLAAINNRLSEYHMQMQDLRHYYMNKLITVDANRNINVIAEEIAMKIANYA
ncbi:adenylate kinase family protein [Wolbachia endosymbiont of Pentidionis agamae]|uniref:adenylate kinase family protein n=1 Tax=Wolbachia endosymbiont of Pentidionis agamae TaxID=3110435 RepID=UPI002FD6D6DF